MDETITPGIQSDESYEEFLNRMLKEQGFEQVKRPQNEPLHNLQPQTGGDIKNDIGDLNSKSSTALTSKQGMENLKTHKRELADDSVNKWEEQYQKEQEELRVFQILDDTIRSRKCTGRDLQASLTEYEIGQSALSESGNSRTKNPSPTETLSRVDSPRKNMQPRKPMEHGQKPAPQLAPKANLNKKLPEAVKRMKTPGKFRIDGRAKKTGEDMKPTKTRYELAQERKKLRKKKSETPKPDNWFNRHKPSSTTAGPQFTKQMPPQPQSSPPVPQKSSKPVTPAPPIQPQSPRTSPVIQNAPSQNIQRPSTAPQPAPSKQIFVDKSMSPIASTQQEEEDIHPPPKKRNGSAFGHLGGRPKTASPHVSMGASRYGVVHGKTWDEFITNEPAPHARRYRRQRGTVKTTTENKAPLKKVNKSTKKMKEVQKQLEAKRSELDQEIAKQKEETEKLRKSKKEHMMLIKLLKEQQEKSREQSENSVIEFERLKKQELKQLQNRRKHLEEETRRVKGLPTKVKEKKHADVLKEQIETMKKDSAKRERRLKDEANSFRIQVKKLIVEKKELKDDVSALQKVRDGLTEQLERTSKMRKHASAKAARRSQAESFPINEKGSFVELKSGGSIDKKVATRPNPKSKKKNTSAYKRNSVNTENEFSRPTGSLRDADAERLDSQQPQLSERRSDGHPVTKSLFESSFGQRDAENSCPENTDPNSTFSNAISEVESTHKNQNHASSNNPVLMNEHTRQMVEQLTREQMNADVIRESLNPVHERNHPDGKCEQIYSDRTKRIMFKNGTEKLIFGTRSSVVNFSNGDIKKILPDGCEVYYFATDDIMHVLHPTGIQEYYFSNTQKETHFPDGLKQIHFADGMSKYVYPDGTEKSVFPDGTVHQLPVSGPHEGHQLHTRPGMLHF